jgi:uncharacterized membrane protein
MPEFAAAYLLFVLSHAIPARPSVRERLTGTLGEWGFQSLYGFVSIVMLAWLIDAAARAPYISLWQTAAWQLWAPVLLMPFVCLFGVGGIAVPNPLSFGGHRCEAFDPQHPGIVGLTRHPLLWAIALWGFAHLLPNGNLAHVILFGSAALFAIVGMLVIDRRKRRLFGAAEWTRLAANTALVPFNARALRVGWLRLMLAAALYAALLFAHARVIGVSPLPPVG